MAMTEHPDMKKYASTMVVDDRSRAQAQRHGLDLLAETEASCMAKVVQAVHLADYVGLRWPTVERIPMAWIMGELRELTEDDLDGWDATEWRVQASVYAVPRP